MRDRYFLRPFPAVGALLAAFVLTGAPGCAPDAGEGAGHGDPTLAEALGAPGEGSRHAGPDPAPRAARSPLASPLSSRVEPAGHGERAEVGQELDDARSTAMVRVAREISPSVVAINVLRTRQVRVRDPFFDDFFGGFFGPPAGRTALRRVPSLGSGFVVDEDGIVLTNDHVVRDAERILVTLPDGRDVEAELVGTDAATDVAVLRLEGTGFPVVPLGRSDDLRIGEWVLAFGNPFGNLISNPEPTATVGVVSAVGRHIIPSGQERGFYVGMIQTDAAVNPGNSGGPLVNVLGQVVGMNASIFTRGGGSEGLGFAIPIERVLAIADDLIEHGRVRRAWVGADVEPVEADEFGRTRGVRASRVVDGSPAGEAGIRPGDRLLEANGRRLVTPLDFEAVLLDLRAGERIELRIEDRDRTIAMTTRESPSVTAERVTVLRDLEVVTLTPAIRQERDVGSEAGALVTGVAPRAQSVLGLQPGDVIVGVNNRRIGSAEELAELLERVPAGARVRLHFERNRGLVTRDFVLGS